jgi:HAD superfamily hydrolase (TIGR01509 family)
VFPPLIGMRVRDQMVALARLTDHPPEVVIQGRERHFWTTLLADGVPATPGVVRTVRRLAALGLSLGVSTSGTRAYVDHVLDALGVRELFTAVTCGDEVTNAKPHPEPYLRAAGTLGMPPAACLAVEDSERGARSARTAGMTVVGYDPRGSGEPASAHARIRRLPDLVRLLEDSRIDPATRPAGRGARSDRGARRASVGP